jgi:hypothetical protein
VERLLIGPLGIVKLEFQGERPRFRNPSIGGLFKEPLDLCFHHLRHVCRVPFP